MILNPQQLLQWQIWVNKEAQQMIIDQQSHGNPANLTYDILTGMGTMADMTVQIANISPQMLHFIREISCRAWAKVDNVNSDGSFVKRGIYPIYRKIKRCHPKVYQILF